MFRRLQLDADVVGDAEGLRPIGGGEKVLEFQHQFAGAIFSETGVGDPRAEARGWGG